MKLLRAINKSELNELLALNKLKTKNQLQPGTEYSFLIHTDTIWADSYGAKRWNLPAIAENEKDKCGVIVETRVFWGRGFQENLSDRGKYYCKKEQLRMVKLNLIQ